MYSGTRTNGSPARKYCWMSTILVVAGSPHRPQKEQYVARGRWPHTSHRPRHRTDDPPVGAAWADVGNLTVWSFEATISAVWWRRNTRLPSIYDPNALKYFAAFDTCLQNDTSLGELIGTFSSKFEAESVGLSRPRSCQEAFQVGTPQAPQYKIRSSRTEEVHPRPSHASPLLTALLYPNSPDEIRLWTEARTPDEMALWVRTDASSWVDCHGTTFRVEPMKVLSLGISRTVPGSMRPALKILGKCSDSNCPTLESPPDIDRWTDALNSRFFGKGPKIAGQEWEQLLGHCEVPASSLTGANLAQELVAVTTTRHSPARYGKAPTDEAVAKLGRNKPFVVSSCLDARFLGRLRPFFKLVWMTFFGDFPSEDIAKKRFQAEHCAAAELGGDVPLERLLEYKAGEGWERVCILLESEHDVTDSEESLAESQPAIISDTRAFGEQMNKITYGVFQGLGSTVVMQIALVGSVGISISFAHKNL
ncbi:hypothetical protein B0H11DRAFT_2199252 [Mycena galericulata]|nr:hypothetical protein B0H11DRAFT_2199252 [Mycena galericulata]